MVTVTDVLTRPTSSSCSGSAALATFGRSCREAELSAAVEDTAAIAELTPAELDEIRAMVREVMREGPGARGPHQGAR